MEILSLNLVNWRNFSQKKIVFDKKLTAIVGKNGSGKSNILAAVAFLSGIRPGRVETDFDLVRFGQESAKILGEVDNNQEKNVLTVNFSSNMGKVSKSYFVGAIKKTLADFLTIFSIVVFEPADLDLVSGSPSLRRHHIDIFLSSLDRDYWRNSIAYNKVIVRRNRLLQRIAEGESKPLELNFWDERLVSHAKYLSRAREDFFDFLNFVEGGASGNKQVLSLKVSAIGGYSWELKQSLLSGEKLLKNRERDIAAGVTLSGPHRDDFRFKFQDRDLEFFGSRGEMRMAVLALKLAEIEYHKIKRGSRPVLALDDIFSELDWEHRETVLSIIGNQQTIITAAEKESIPKEIFKKATVIEI